MSDTPIPFWHAQTTTDTAELAQRDPVVVLPLAAIEQHGPHLPLSTDLDIGERALIATGTLGSFRCAYGMREIGEDGSIAIDGSCAATLEVGEGDEVWSVAR